MSDAPFDCQTYQLFLQAGVYFLYILLGACQLSRMTDAPFDCQNYQLILQASIYLYILMAISSGLVSGLGGEGAQKLFGFYLRSNTYAKNAMIS